MDSKKKISPVFLKIGGLKKKPSALASLTLSLKEPSVATQVKPPSQKRRLSKSPPKSSLKRLRKPFVATSSQPATVSQQSGAVEIVPSGPRESVLPLATSSVPSQNDTVVSSGTPTIPSSTTQLVDEDDLDFFPVQGASSAQHSLSPDHLLVEDFALPHEGVITFLVFLRVSSPSAAEGEKPSEGEQHQPSVHVSSVQLEENSAQEEGTDGPTQEEHIDPAVVTEGEAPKTKAREP